jgi:amino acid transporter
MSSVTKRVLVGKPLTTQSEGGHRLPKWIALPVFSADAVASSAFATQEILSVLVPVAGAAALSYLVPISVVVVLLLVIVVSSYRQTIFAYPSGGGSYIVSRENLGRQPSLFAGASLLVDYTLTVAVSIAAGTAAITSAVSGLRGHEAAVAVTLTALLALANLRGLKESGQIFAPPTYAYIALMVLLIGYGLFRSFTGNLAPLPVNQANINYFTDNGALLGPVTAFLLARAFSSGAIALSGVEAISNGVPAFKPPESRNAAITLTWTGTILAVLFTGVAVLAHRLQPTLSPDQTILSIMGRTVFGNDSPLYFLLQAATAAILILSANTAFADFPRLSSIIARDGFLPRQLAHRGDRLVYSNGIIILAAAAIALLIGFQGEVTRLVPLFAVGLFASFTLSQLGMVVHHRREREQGWHWKAVVNGVGSVTTAVVLVVVVVSKFTEGAFIPVIVIPLIVYGFHHIHRHYERFNSELAIDPTDPPPPVKNSVVILVGRMHRGVPAAVAYAEALHPHHLVAITVETDPEETPRIMADWTALGFDVPLVVVPSPYREITTPILEYLDELDSRWGDDIITVIIPEFIVHKWREQFLHNQSALALKVRLLFRRNTVVVSIPTHVG